MQKKVRALKEAEHLGGCNSPDLTKRFTLKTSRSQEKVCKFSVDISEKLRENGSKIGDMP